ncbi:MAG: hypothetical protein JST54_14795 [Deltaproteobacteria bacterium]|nr:hypothetical protein [Deltaproteobacteria bacterium]
MNALVLSLVLVGASPTAKPPASSEVTLASQGFEMAEGQYQAGVLTMEVVLTWATRLHDAQRAANDAQADANHLTRLQALHDIATRRLATGTATKLDVLAVEVAQARAARGQ